MTELNFCANIKYRSFGLFKINKPKKGRRWVMNRSIIVIISLFVILALSAGCASTVATKGREFNFKPGAVGLGSSKLEVMEAYGKPVHEWSAGVLEFMEYEYGTDKLKHDRAIGNAALSVATFGLSDLVVDHGVKSGDVKRDYRSALFVLDRSGKVVNYFYHDSDGNAQDESEKLLLKAENMISKGDFGQAIPLLRQARESNPKNHRVLNCLAWYLADLGINPQEAVGISEESIRLWPYDPSYFDTLGTAQYKIGDNKGAIDSLQKALDLYAIYAADKPKSKEHTEQMLKAAQDAFK